MPALNCLHMETQVHARHRPALVHGHVRIYTCTHVHTHTAERKNGLFNPNTTCSCQEARSLVSRQPLPHSTPHRC